MTGHTQNHPVEPLLLPRPRRLERVAGTFAPVGQPARGVAERIPGAHFRHLVQTVRKDEDWERLLGIRCVRSAELPREGYRLILRSDADGPAQLASSGPEGVRAALATLAQLQTQYGDHIPAMVIEDEPVFATRGVMLDISRGRVPTMAHFYETIDLLASLKINHLQLYTEHTFAYRGHEVVWQGSDPITPAEVGLLDERCRSVGIELAANQNCFGHLHRWLKHPDYAHLAEIVGNDTKWNFLGMDRFGGFSVCPTDPRSFEFVAGLLDELLPHFSSDLVNIGCDETADIGQGRSRDDVAARGSAVYTDFVTQVAQCVLDKGKRPMFWGDVALSKPECLNDLPEDLLALAWGYEADSPFNEWGATLSAAGRPFWVCPGTSSWRSITGRTSDRKANLENAARNGARYRASGFMVTDWGDVGHRQQWPISLRGLADAADAAWTGYEQGAANVGAVSLHAFGDPISLRKDPTPNANKREHGDSSGGNGVAALLDDLGDADESLRAACGVWNPTGSQDRLHNATALFTDLHRPFCSQPMPGTPEQWRAVRHRLTSLFEGHARLCRDQSSLPSLPPVATAAFSRLMQEIMHALNVAIVAAVRASVRRPCGQLVNTLDPELRRDLAEQLQALTAEHRKLWLARSRPGGLNESCACDEKVIAELRGAAE